MQLRVCLLSEKENPEIGAFLVHLNCHFSHFSDLNKLSLFGLKNKIDLILLDEKWFKNESSYRDLRTALSRLKKGRVIILSTSVKNYKLSYSGICGEDDFNTLKRIVEDSQSMRKIFTPAFINTHKSEEEEVVVEVDEEVEDYETNVFTKGFVRIKSSESLDQLGLVLCDTLEKGLKEKRKGVFFKYLSSYCSLIVVGSFNFAKSKAINGVGLDFSKSSEFSPKNHFSLAMEIPPFKRMIEKLFTHADVELKTLTAGVEVRGLLVYEKARLFLEAEKSDENLNRLVDMANTKLEALNFKRLYQKNRIKDTVTDVLLLESFFEAFQNEIIRSKRIFLPVSLFIIEIDHYDKIIKKYNSERLRLLMKSLAQVLQTSVRHNDSVGKVSDKRFGVLFPHMHQVDAVKKAQSIIKSVAQTQFFSDMKDPLYCSLSVAVGTYPNHATSADELYIRLQNSLDQRETFGEVIKIDLPVGLKKDFEELKLADLLNLQNRKSTVD